MLLVVGSCFFGEIRSVSGHSKWNNIKRKKEKADGARAKFFTKVGRELTVAVREGGSANPDNNSKLRDCILKAKANNVPNENIERIIKKAARDGEGVNYEYITYEGYGPGGVALIVKCLTDNRNRTAGNVRHYFDKCSGNLGTSGCVSYLFKEVGLISVGKNSSINEDSLTMDAIDSGADDVIENEDCFDVISSVDCYSSVKSALENKGYIISRSELSLLPNSYTFIDENQLLKLEKLLDLLEDDDDVQDVYNNCENFK